MTLTTVSRLALLVALAICQCTDGQMDSAFNFGDGSSVHDLKEIHRQNQITKQILQNYLEKRLYGKGLSRTPSLLDILPNDSVMKTPAANNIQSLLSNNTDDNDSRETLEGEETIRDDTYYEDFEEAEEGCGARKSGRKKEHRMKEKVLAEEYKELDEYER